MDNSAYVTRGPYPIHKYPVNHDTYDKVSPFGLSYVRCDTMSCCLMWGFFYAWCMDYLFYFLNPRTFYGNNPIVRVSRDIMQTSGIPEDSKLVYSPHSSRHPCFIFSSEKGPWDEYETVCKKYGGKMAMYPYLNSREVTFTHFMEDHQIDYAWINDYRYWGPWKGTPRRPVLLRGSMLNIVKTWKSFYLCQNECSNTTIVKVPEGSTENDTFLITPELYTGPTIQPDPKTFCFIVELKKKVYYLKSQCRDGPWLSTMEVKKKHLKLFIGVPHGNHSNFFFTLNGDNSFPAAEFVAYGTDKCSNELSLLYHKINHGPEYPDKVNMVPCQVNYTRHNEYVTANINDTGSYGTLK